MKFAVIVFPGSNCDHDAHYALTEVLGQQVNLVWHKDQDLGGADVVVLPGGFSYGDYLRTGAIAKFSPVMSRVTDFAAAGGPVIGICNGFQVLYEAGLLPGGMRRNQPLKFIPIAHGEGNYYADSDTVRSLQEHRQIVFRYTAPDGSLDDSWNVNGSVDAIAGICNRDRNVVGLMPHPERACEDAVGSRDGRVVLQSVLSALDGPGGLPVNSS